MTTLHIDDMGELRSAIATRDLRKVQLNPTFQDVWLTYLKPISPPILATGVRWSKYQSPFLTSHEAVGEPHPTLSLCGLTLALDKECWSQAHHHFQLSMLWEAYPYWKDHEEHLSEDVWNALRMVQGELVIPPSVPMYQDLRWMQTQERRVARSEVLRTGCSYREVTPALHLVQGLATSVGKWKTWEMSRRLLHLMAHARALESSPMKRGGRNMKWRERYGRWWNQIILRHHFMQIRR